MQRQQGVILERWDRVDGYLVKRLLQDPRFPTIPTYAGIRPTFNEPDNWGENYGSRLRGYFVPQQSGPHRFAIGIGHEDIQTVRSCSLFNKECNATKKKNEKIKWLFHNLK